MASPGRSEDDGSGGADAAGVCCMCGDHGLPRDLFRCRLCRLRLQHRYCSDLYPSAGPYRSCNWCLREEGAHGGGGSGTPPVKPPLLETTAAAAAEPERDQLPNDSRDDGGGRDNNERLRPPLPHGAGCSRSAFAADPGKPVKKPKRRTSTVHRPAEARRRREVQAGAAAGGGIRTRSRAKLRRYKLLAEVIC